MRILKCVTKRRCVAKLTRRFARGCCTMYYVLTVAIDRWVSSNGLSVAVSSPGLFNRAVSVATMQFEMSSATPERTHSLLLRVKTLQLVKLFVCCDKRNCWKFFTRTLITCKITCKQYCGYQKTFFYLNFVRKVGPLLIGC